MQQNGQMALVMVLAALLFGTDIVTSSIEPRQKLEFCTDKDGEFVPMQGSCSGFYICQNGIAIASSCGKFYQFNTETNICDHPERVQCKIESNPIIVEIEEPDYYEPVMPTLQPLIPPNALPGFPPHIPKPQGPEEVVPDESAGNICEFQRNGVYLPKADSCTHFYVCLMRLPYRRTCPPMLHFNAENGLCQDPALAQCMIKSIDSPIALELATFGNAITCSGMPNGILLPHWETCEKFYNCEDGQRIEMNCPIGLHFSVRHQRCEWPRLARCSV